MTDSSNKATFDFHGFYYKESAQNKFRGRPWNLVPRWLFEQPNIETNLTHLDIESTPQTRSPPPVPDVNVTQQDDAMDLNNLNQPQMPTNQSVSGRASGGHRSIGTPSVAESNFTIDSRQGRTPYGQLKLRIEQMYNLDKPQLFDEALALVDVWYQRGNPIH